MSFYALLLAFIAGFPATHYYAPHPGHSLEDLAWSRDSLSLTERTSNAVKKSIHYFVASTEKRGDYILLIAKPLTAPTYSLIVLSFSPDKQSLHVLHEEQLSYPSIEACRQAGRNIDLSTKYFYTYYPEKVFFTYLRQPSIDQADSATMHHILQEYIGAFIRQKDKIKQTKTLDPYLAGHGQDVLSQVLVHYHYNPTADLTDMGKKMRQYHIRLPPQIQ